MSEIAFDIEIFLEKAKELPVIDVRTPAEFKQAHIPGALNMPLFSNEERSVIGTLYVNKGSSDAIVKGLEFIRPRLDEFKKAAWQAAPLGEALLHCWRGGMRSNSMAWLLNTIGLKSHTLKGGYKSYRRFILSYFARPLKNLVVIGGMTGSGKTEILEEIERKGFQVINLERLAFHKGSVFGDIGMPEQPSGEQFENNLFCEIYKLDSARPVFIEDESIAVGKVFLPAALFDQMSKARFIQISISMERRVNNLIAAYTSHDNDEMLVTAVNRINKRLGYSNAAEITGFIRQKKYAQAVQKILCYYDKLYAASMDQHHRNVKHTLNFNNETISAQADQIINLITKNGN